MASKKKKPAGMTAMQKLVISEWRGYEEPEDLSVHEHAIATLITRVMAKADLENRCDITELCDRWTESVGAFVAKYSKPEIIKDGVLYITVLQPSVRFELERAHRKKILADVQSAFPLRGIKEVRFRLG